MYAVRSERAKNDQHVQSDKFTAVEVECMLKTKMSAEWAQINCTTESSHLGPRTRTYFWN